MNHIKEMMKTAGIKPKYKYTVTGQATTFRVDADWLIWKFKDRKSKSVFKVVKVNKYLSDFTAEKQLELIQLIASERGLLMKENALTVLNLKREKDIELCVDGCFVQGLAALVTNLIKAGELDKEKVKEILEK